MSENRILKIFDLKISTDEHPSVRLNLIGPSSQGWIYRTEDNSACYRLLLPEEAPVPRRSSIRNWTIEHVSRTNSVQNWLKDPKKYKIAPIQSADFDKESKFFFIHYGISIKNTLLDILSSADLATKINHAIKIISQIPNWWGNLYRGIIPMPADIIFSEDDYPYILPIPFWMFPQIESILAEPERGLYMAPEYIRGKSDLNFDLARQYMDIYAFGVILLQCFFKIPNTISIERLMLQIANGTIKEYFQNNIPLWLYQYKKTQEIVSMLYQMISSDLLVRSAFDPSSLITKLLNYLWYTDPKEILESMLNSGHLWEAYNLLKEILLFDDSYDILILAGRIARISGMIFEAIDFYERAIVKAPADRLDAYEEQFDLIVSEALRVSMREIKSADFISKLDGVVQRDFDRLELSIRSDKREYEMANYLLWRERYIDASYFIYKRLFDSKGRFLELKIPLRTAYVESLMGLNRIDDAIKELNNIRNSLCNAVNRLPNNEIEQYRRIATTIENKINNRLKGL